MSMSDPIADMLTRIRNAQMVEKAVVLVPSSKVKVAIAQVLKDEGYIDGFAVKTNDGKSQLEIALKYYAGKPVIERIERVSRPGLRVYKGHGAIPQVMNGLGVLTVGYSHPVVMDMPAGITVATPTPTEIVIKGSDRQRVGQIAAEVRAVRPPEPYKGKGIRYSDEKITIKETKKK